LARRQGENGKFDRAEPQKDALMSYTERYVAFLDILGFSEIVARSASGDARQVDALKSVLQQVGQRNPRFDKQFADDFRLNQFSDSIVISENASPGGLSHLLVSVSDLSLSLLTSGLLLRGGVAKGLLYHDDRLAFGPAFLDAYRIESTIAKFPRVVLSASVWTDVKEYRQRPDWIARLVLLDDDGPAFVNVLLHLQMVSDLPPPENFNYLNSDYGAKYLFCRPTLEKLLETSMHDPRKFEKVKWFAVYWNSTLAQRNGPFEPVSLPLMLENSAG
jgi:hypothetical protein